MALGKRLRFEVFKRDSFTCQYCGRKAPDVLLQVDHIQPKSKKGKDTIINLITACRDCNLGKTNNLLSENTVMEKQRKQLEELQQKKEQLEFMFEWQKSLLDIEETLVQKLSNYWSEKVKGYRLTESGLLSLRSLVKQYQLDEILKAINIATTNYLVCNNETFTQTSVEDAFKKVGGICHNTKLARENPQKFKIMQIRNILQKKCGYFNNNVFFAIMDNIQQQGFNLDNIEQISKRTRNWRNWKEEVSEYITNKGE